ncbi:MAG TPA: cyclase family protein [Candidatus Methylomirabilis sp.]|nr:cyclase family protein [Candidatus Methylomirabilis sp.]
MIPLAMALVCFSVGLAMAGALERAMLGKSQVVDLTHALDERALSLLPAPPTDPPSPGQDRPRNEGPGEGDQGSALPASSVPADLKTHPDVPVAVDKGKSTVAEIPARDLFVHAVLVDVSAKVAQTAEYRVTVEDLRGWERRNGRIPKRSVVLLHTGWSRRWGDTERYLNLDTQGIPRVPGFTPAALSFLEGERGVGGVGLDTFSADGMPENRHAETRALLHAGKWQLVNLTNLDQLPVKGAKLVIAPLRLDAESAPVRVIAILP